MRPRTRSLTAMFVRGFEARFGHHVYGFDWVMLAGVALVYQLLGWQAARFAGNATGFAPLLVQWLTGEDWPPRWKSLTLMFQREVVDRMVAEAEAIIRGRLSGMVG